MTWLLLATALAWSPPDTPDENTARVCFVRSGQFFNSNNPWTVRSADRPVVELYKRRFLCVDAEPGEYRLSIRGTFSTSSSMTATGRSGNIGTISGVGDTQLEDWLKLQLAGGTLTILDATYRDNILLWEPREPDALLGRRMRPARMRHVYRNEL